METPEQRAARIFAEDAIIQQKRREAEEAEELQENQRRRAAAVEQFKDVVTNIYPGPDGSTYRRNLQRRILEFSQRVFKSYDDEYASIGRPYRFPLFDEVMMKRFKIPQSEIDAIMLLAYEYCIY